MMRLFFEIINSTGPLVFPLLIAIVICLFSVYKSVKNLKESYILHISIITADITIIIFCSYFIYLLIMAGFK